MFDSLFAWIGEMLSANHTFSDLKEGFIDFLEEIGFDDHVTNLRDGLLNGFKHIEFIIPIFLILLFVSMALFGRQIFSILRFSALFVGGFIIGVFVLSEPILKEFPELPTWTIGLCIGIVAAVLSKPIFAAAYGIFFGYGSYLLICGGSIPFLHKNYFVAAVVALGVIFAVFYFRSYVEMGMTSLLGVYGVCAVFAQFFGVTPTPFVEGVGGTVLLIITVILTVPAFIFQFKHRDRFLIK